MTKIYTNSRILGFTILFIYVTGEELCFYNLLRVWVLLLVFSYQKIKNHLVSMILILELLSVMRLFAARFYVKIRASLNLIFILIRIIVGEATLGLAVLISLVRSSTNSLIMSRIS